MKKCSMCKNDKNIDQFGRDKSRNDGLETKCKSCKKLKRKKEYTENREEILSQTKQYYQNNREERLAYKKQWDSENREKQLGYSKKWQNNNREYLREYDKERYHADINVRVKKRMSTDINDCLSGRKNRRHWEDLVGYTLEQLKTHLESQFQLGMSWDNWGRGTECWHIDHVRPQSWYNFEEESQLKECWSLSNLTCKWEFDNLSKGNRSEG